MNLASSSIRAFVPGGRDYERSKAFYEALGFSITFDAGEVAGLRHGTNEFLLQNYYNEEWAGNFMMQLTVEDLDAWWAHIESLDLPGRFSVPEPRPPALMPWGLREINLIGPGGELWHIVQAEA
jgi:hypothetical protein